MNSNEPLLPDDWNELSPMVDRLLDTPSSERAALLDELAGYDPARRAQLERLVAECERELELLDRPAIEQFPQLLQEDAGPLLPEVLGGHYRIERELGRGGMARVYLAQDVRHSRLVAVKVIRHEIASSLGRDRFLREIGIAARLRHPNIMPLYDSGDVDGLLYFVMPYEEGKSLRARLDASPRLAVAEGVSILRDVARALAYAHEQGVVHRDVKPDNVMLSGDAAVVTDFGIAKALTVAATESGLANATQAGTVIGTPAYMSPEQAVGDPNTDHRADIYAFGCLAYELFAGAPPYTGATTHEVISAKLSAPLKPLTDHRPDTPAAVAQLIARCLEKDPAARPASGSELLDVLGTMTTTRESARPRRRRARSLMTAVLALVVVVLGGWYAFTTRGGAVTIAVLPLQVTGDAAQEIAEGFTEDLANALARVPWLKVMSRGGSNNYRGLGDFTPRAVGDSLRVRYFIMGSLRQDGGRYSVMLQLINCEDGSLVWGNKFARPVHLEVFRDEVVRAIADTLRGQARRFANRFPADFARRQYGANDNAYRTYLAGKQKLSERGRSVAASIDLFRSAIALDSSSAEAWSGLSLALAISAISQNASVESIRTEATKSAKAATRLNPALAEPHVAIAVVHALGWRWQDAEGEFKEALRLDPQHLEARIQYARVFFAQNRIAAAQQQVDSALAADPQSSLALGFKGQVLALQGQLDSAVKLSDLARTRDPSNYVVRIFREMLLLQLGRHPEARELAQDAPPFEPYALYVLAVTGDSVTVRHQLTAIRASGKLPPAAETATAYGLLGLRDTAGALDALDRATVRGEIWPNISPAGLPVFDSIRNSTRFRELRRRVGLDAR